MINRREVIPLYAASAAAPAPRPALAGDTDADVAIVGAGLTGAGAALTLAEAGADVLVLEATRVGGGASGVSGGQVHPGHRRDQTWLERHLGEEKAHALWALAEEARLWLGETIARHRIACDDRPGLLHLAHRPAIVEAFAAEADLLARRYGAKGLRLVKQAELPDYTGARGYAGGLFDPHGGHLDPLALTRGLIAAAERAGARLVEESPALSIERAFPHWLITTASGTVRAKAVILTGDGTLGRLVPEVGARVLPIVNFMIATEPLGARADTVLRQPIAASDTRHIVNYFRRTGDGRLIFGGGESYGSGLPRGFAERARRRMLAIFPDLADARIDHAWGGVLGVTAPRLPFVRRLDADFYVASGYSGQGVLLAPFTGRAIARALAGDTEAFELLAGLPVPRLPGGRLMRRPLLIAAMIGYGLLDRL